ncbi:MAG: Cupin domain protein [Candidatus Saccharibacteria bacterium]|nr:Cupin domain protein [Candidatus Saccharibacteria bacterium]
MPNADLPTFDPAAFNTESYVQKYDKPWGYELHWVPAGLPYMGKVLHINEGTRISLQLHDAKQESWFLFKGRAMIIWENDQGELVETEMQPGQGYTTQIGQRHRLAGLTDCDIIEVSSPERGTTYRLEDDYARPHETPEQRQIERA